MIHIALDSGSAWPDSPDWTELATVAARATISQTSHGRFVSAPFVLEISIKLTNDAEVKELNAQYRDKDKATNILSFPQVQEDLLPALGNSDDGEVLLGDMVLAIETCAREAEEKGISLNDHVAHLFCHGILHLLGYDHEQDEATALQMEELERKALASLNIADPYAPND